LQLRSFLDQPRRRFGRASIGLPNQEPYLFETGITFGEVAFDSLPFSADQLLINVGRQLLVAWTMEPIRSGK
jgi:hypothetical protein